MASVPSPYQLVDDMVDSVLRNTSQPNNQQTFQSDDVVALLDEEQKTTVTELIQSVREEYFIQYSDIPLVQGVTSYTIPVRSVMATLEDVVLVDASGNEIEIAQLDPSQLKVQPFYTYIPASIQRGAYLRNDSINTWPLTLPYPTGYTLRMKYARRPNTLTMSTNCGKITAIDTLNHTITLSNVPSAWTTSTIVDIINNNPQFQAIQDGQTISAINGFIITLPALPAGIAVGQWVCPMGMTCVPQIPMESYPLLINLGAQRVYMAQQNASGFQITSKLVETQYENVKSMLTPRWKGQPRKIVNKNVSWPLSGIFPTGR